jgi:hypothetical protein
MGFLVAGICGALLCALIIGTGYWDARRSPNGEAGAGRGRGSLGFVSTFLAGAYGTGHLITAFLLIFWATFPFENQSPEEAANDDWLIGVAVGVVVVGLVATFGIVFLTRWAVAAYAAAVVAGGALLAWALNVSENSDGKLLLWAAAIELTGLAAVVVSRAR